MGRYVTWPTVRPACSTGPRCPTTARGAPRPGSSGIERLRRTEKLGPARIGARLGIAASTVYRLLVRLGLNGILWLDRPSGRLIRRYERERPGELVPWT